MVVFADFGISDVYYIWNKLCKKSLPRGIPTEIGK